MCKLEQLKGVGLALGSAVREGAAPTKSAADKAKAADDFRDKEAVKSNKVKETDSRTDKTAPLSRRNHTIKMTERFFCRHGGS